MHEKVLTAHEAQLLHLGSIVRAKDGSRFLKDADQMTGWLQIEHGEPHSYAMIEYILEETVNICYIGVI